MTEDGGRILAFRSFSDGGVAPSDEIEIAVEGSGGIDESIGQNQGSEAIIRTQKVKGGGGGEEFDVGGGDEAFSGIPAIDSFSAGETADIDAPGGVFANRLQTAVDFLR